MQLSTPTFTFQSPRSGKFESNEKLNQIVDNAKLSFQSPRSGKFESNKAGSNTMYCNKPVSIP